MNIKKFLLSIFLIIILQPLCLGDLVTNPTYMDLARQRADARAKMHQLDIQKAQRRQNNMPYYDLEKQQRNLQEQSNGLGRQMQYNQNEYSQRLKRIYNTP